MEKIYNISKIRHMALPIFQQYKIKKATLFGDYASGRADKDSNIQIVVDSQLKGLAFFGLYEDLNTEFDRMIELIEICQVKPDSDLERELAETGIVIYDSERDENTSIIEIEITDEEKLTLDKVLAENDITLDDLLTQFYRWIVEHPDEAIPWLTRGGAVK